MRDKVLLNKYRLVVESVGNVDLGEKVGRLDELIRASMDSSENGRELFTAYNDLLLDLLHSSDPNVTRAVTNAMNKAPEVQGSEETDENEPEMPEKEKVTEEDEAMGNANDNKNGVTGTSF